MILSVVRSSPPQPHRLVADVGTALEQQALHVLQAQRTKCTFMLMARTLGRAGYPTGTPTHSHVRRGRPDDHFVDVDAVRLLDRIMDGSSDRVRRQ